MPNPQTNLIEKVIGHTYETYTKGLGNAAFEYFRENTLSWPTQRMIECTRNDEYKKLITAIKEKQDDEALDQCTFILLTIANKSKNYVEQKILSHEAAEYANAILKYPRPIILNKIAAQKRLQCLYTKFPQLQQPIIDVPVAPTRTALIQKPTMPKKTQLIFPHKKSKPVSDQEDLLATLQALCTQYYKQKKYQQCADTAWQIVTQTDVGTPFHSQAYSHLTTLADSGHPSSLYYLCNLHANEPQKSFFHFTKAVALSKPKNLSIAFQGINTKKDTSCLIKSPAQEKAEEVMKQLAAINPEAHQALATHYYYQAFHNPAYALPFFQLSYEHLQKAGSTPSADKYVPGDDIRFWYNRFLFESLQTDFLYSPTKAMQEMISLKINEPLQAFEELQRKQYPLSIFYKAHAMAFKASILNDMTLADEIINTYLQALKSGSCHAGSALEHLTLEGINGFPLMPQQRLSILKALHEHQQIYQSSLIAALESQQYNGSIYEEYAQKKPSAKLYYEGVFSYDIGDKEQAMTLLEKAAEKGVNPAKFLYQNISLDCFENTFTADDITAVRNLTLAILEDTQSNHQLARAQLYTILEKLSSTHLEIKSLFIETLLIYGNLFPQKNNSELIKEQIHQLYNHGNTQSKNLIFNTKFMANILAYTQTAKNLEIPLMVATYCLQELSESTLDCQQTILCQQLLSHVCKHIKCAKAYPDAYHFTLHDTYVQEFRNIVKKHLESPKYQSFVNLYNKEGILGEILLLLSDNDHYTGMIDTALNALIGNMLEDLHLTPKVTKGIPYYSLPIPTKDKAYFLGQNLSHIRWQIAQARGESTASYVVGDSDSLKSLVQFLQLPHSALTHEEKLLRVTGWILIAADMALRLPHYVGDIKDSQLIFTDSLHQAITSYPVVGNAMLAREYSMNEIFTADKAKATTYLHAAIKELNKDTSAQQKQYLTETIALLKPLTT